MDRRDFLKTTGLAAVGASAIRTLSGATQSVSIIVRSPRSDRVRCCAPVHTQRLKIPGEFQFHRRFNTGRTMGSPAADCLSGGFTVLVHFNARAAFLL
jgi:hypothetical protein